MSFIEKSKIFYIDSDNRINGTNSDFSFSIDLGRDNEFDSVCVLQASIPKSYYLIPDGGNTMILTENGIDEVITFPVGNYSRSSLMAQTQLLLNTNSPHGWTYTISVPNTSINPETGLYTFTVSGNMSQPRLTFVNNILHEVLGFDRNTSYDFVGDVLTSVDVVKLQKEDTLFIRSDIASNGTDNILQEIFTFDSLDYSNIVFLNPSVEAYSKALVSNTANSFRFYLTDENATTIDLNGQNWQMTILVYKKQNLFNVLKDFIKMKLLEDE